MLLWPGNYTPADVSQAEAALNDVLTYSGLFWIEDGATTEPGNPGPKAEIEWIKFRAELMRS